MVQPPLEAKEKGDAVMVIRAVTQTKRGQMSNGGLVARMPIKEEGTE